MDDAKTKSEASKIGHEKSEEAIQQWQRMYESFTKKSAQDVLHLKETNRTDTPGNNVTDTDDKKVGSVSLNEGTRRWILALRHGERMDITYGSWIPYCFDDDDKYTRKDLNMPLTLPARPGGKWAYLKDCPLTRVGQLQSMLVGEGLREAGVTIKHVYSSPTLRSVQTAQELLKGLNSDPSVKIRVEPGLFEYKAWHTMGIGPFMTPVELHKAGYDVDLSYTPYVELSLDTNETVQEFYERGAKVTHGAYSDTQAEGGNIIFVGHGPTLDTMWQTLRRYGNNKEHPPYALSRALATMSYCALAAMKDNPFQLVAPPCPPSINTESKRFDWNTLCDLKEEKQTGK